jgi:hypothetical protein
VAYPFAGMPVIRGGCARVDIDARLVGRPAWNAQVMSLKIGAIDTRL